ncbi:MAG: hypothetical protein U1A77_19465 [Pirellulales bacterium]
MSQFSRVAMPRLKASMLFAAGLLAAVFPLAGSEPLRAQEADVAAAVAAQAGKSAQVELTNEVLDAPTRVVHATVKLFHPRSTATGFLVALPDSAEKKPGQCIIVTAKHVFEQTVGETMVLVLRKKEPDGAYSRRDHTIPIREKEKPLWAAHSTADVAALLVTLPENTSLVPLPYSTLADEAALRRAKLSVGGRLLTACYPARFEANAAGFPVTRNGGIASFPLWPVAKHPVFLLDVTAFAGDSGGPVYWVPSQIESVEENGNVQGQQVQPTTSDPANEEKSSVSVEREQLPLVVGIVSGQVRNDEKIQTLYEERVAHYPLGISVVVHSQHAREAIESLLKR